MIGIAVAACASVLASTTLMLVLRHGEALAEIGLRTALVVALLLMPAAPFVILVGAARIGAIPSLLLALSCCFPSFFVARKAIQIIERTGTDRFDKELEAMSRLMGAVIGMMSFVAVFGIFMAIALGDGGV
jgi:hypothetical protein